MPPYPINSTLAALEYHTKLGPTFAARLLGVAYPTYAQYRSGRRELPTYHHHHIQCLFALNAQALKNIITEYTND